MSNPDRNFQRPYATRSTGPPPESIEQHQRPRQNRRKQKKLLGAELISFSEDEMTDDQPATGPISGEALERALMATDVPKDVVVPLTTEMPDKKLARTEVFNNQGYATYSNTIQFAKTPCIDSTDIFVHLTRGKTALPFPAFPVDISRPNMNTHEFYIWFCQASGMGYILDRMALNAEKISPENAMRYGIGTLVTYKISDVTIYPMSVVDKVTFAVLKSAYPGTVMTEEIWNKYNRNQKFSYLGTIFNYMYMTRPTMTSTQLISYAYARFCFAVLGKEPSASTCNLIRAMTNSKIEFSFSPGDMLVWEDMTSISVEKKQELLKNIFKRPNDLTEIFEILYNRFKTYGLTSMITITEALKKFPAISWQSISDEWYHGELEKYMAAAEVIVKLDFPALHKDVLTKHSVTGYRRFAGFCAKVLEFSGMSPSLRNHEGLKRVRLPDDRVQYIKSMIASPAISKNMGLPQSTYDRINAFSKTLCGVDFEDPGIAQQRQAAIEAKIRERDKADKERLRKMFEDYQAEVRRPDQPTEH